MRTLVIDCATEACSVALFDGVRLLAADHRMLGRGHAERLVPMIAALPDRGKAARIAVAMGPGSFTGVRIGLATARALALVRDAQVVGYPTLALVAAMALAARDSGAASQPVDVVMTGGHGEWFVQGFDHAGHALAPLSSITPQQAASTLNAPLAAGSQAEALVAQRGSGAALALWPDARQFPLLAPDWLDPHPAPLYGRAPDAKLPGGAGVSQDRRQ